MEKIAAIVLAAGASRRHPAGNKLLRTIDGAPMLLHCLQKVAGCDFGSLICVVRPGDEEISALAYCCGFKVVVNELAEHGVGGSIGAGVKTLSNEIDGAAIFLGDMPSIKIATIKMLLARFRAAQQNLILRPMYEGRPGHPVFFSHDWFAKLKLLKGDKGARSLMAVTSMVEYHLVNDRGVVTDFDDPAAFEAH